MGRRHWTIQCQANEESKFEVLEHWLADPSEEFLESALKGTRLKKE